MTLVNSFDNPITISSSHFKCELYYMPGSRSPKTGGDPVRRLRKVEPQNMQYWYVLFLVFFVFPVDVKGYCNLSTS